MQGGAGGRAVSDLERHLPEITEAYDRAHALIMSRGGAVPSGELRHHCATTEDSLYMNASGSRKNMSGGDGQATSPTAG